MKGLVLVIIIFLICALVGYQVAIYLAPIDDGPGPGTNAEVANPGNGLSVILIHVDHLDRSQPRLVSVWYVSLFFVDGAPPRVALAQMYPAPGIPGRNQAFERSFSLTREGDPSPIFLRGLKSQDIQWEGYLLIDDFTVQNVMEWTNGAGDFTGLLGSTQSNPVESERVLKHTCEDFGQLEQHGPAPFSINDLMPAHFRSDLSMDEAWSYWNSITTSEAPIRCDVLLAP